jgi:uncharacterized protein involved in exopolysaccharide biosynthesis
MLAFIIICSGVGIITAMNLPPTYRTNATLLIEGSLLEEDTRNRNQDDGTEQLQVIQRRLLTRANLIDIANKYDVFNDEEDLEPDEIIDLMRQSTSIRSTSGRNQATSMVIGFQARTGQIAANVVNEYLTLIQQDASSTRETQARQRITFFEQEVDRLKVDLDRQSVRIVEFKGQNANALPDDAENLRSRQIVLLDRLDRLGTDKVLFADQREEIVAIFEETGQINPVSSGQLTVQERQLEALKLELDGLRAIYSDTYPGVVSLEARIARLETTVLSQSDSGNGLVDDDNVEDALLRASLGEIDDRIAATDLEITQTEEELQQIGDLLTSVSGNAIELSSLERDFEIVESRYNLAVENLDQARLDVRINRARQGERIEVIESADVPQLPTGPNRAKIAAMGIGAGLGLAGGFFMLLEFLNRSIRRPAEIQSRFNIVPIAVIPYIESRRERLLRRSALIVAVLAVLIVVPAILWYIDTNHVPLELIAERIMDKLTG